MEVSTTLRALISGAVIATGTAFEAGAATLTFYGDWNSPPPGPMITYDADDDRGSLICEFSCSGLLSTLDSGIYPQNVPSVSTSGAWSDVAADLFYLANNSLTSETAFVNAALGLDFATGTKIDGTGGSQSFTSAAEYILFKIGRSPDMALIWNNSGRAQVYTYTAFSGEGAGLSHYTEYGRVPEVPLPASASLMFAGLALLGAFGKGRLGKRARG